MTDKPRRPNYHAAIAAALLDHPLKPGTVTDVRVYHDDFCALFAGGVCDCNPGVRLVTVEPDSSPAAEEPDRE